MNTQKSNRPKYPWDTLRDGTSQQRSHPAKNSSARGPADRLTIVPRKPSKHPDPFAPGTLLPRSSNRLLLQLDSHRGQARPGGTITDAEEVQKSPSKRTGDRPEVTTLH